MLEQDVIVSTEEDHYKTDVQVRKHSLLADEPKEEGGTDQGPSPYEYVLSGLGACTAITLRMYADRKEWPLKKVTVRLNLDRQKEDGQDKTIIQRKIHVEGELTDEQIQRLLVIANSCPVHKLLRSDITIESEIL